MQYTGERPDVEEGLFGSRIRYKSILPFCINKTVLDYGCGIGCGSHFLSHFSKSVVGYDICEEAIAFGNVYFDGSQNFCLTNDFECISLGKKYEVITMVELIEHLEKEDLLKLLQTFVKTNPQADLACTTPDGYLFPYQPTSKSDRRGFHIWHYTEEELQQIFRQFYKFVVVTGCARDPRLNKWTGYTIFATNKIEWSDEWLNVAKF